MKTKLGDTVKDPVTGIKGIAYSYITYLHGCERIGIQQAAYVNKAGETIVPDLFYVDDPQLEVIKTTVENKTKKLGGPSGFGKTHKPIY